MKTCLDPRRTGRDSGPGRAHVSWCHSGALVRRQAKRRGAEPGKRWRGHRAEQPGAQGHRGTAKASIRGEGKAHVRVILQVCYHHQRSSLGCLRLAETVCPYGSAARCRLTGQDYCVRYLAGGAATLPIDWSTRTCISPRRDRKKVPTSGQVLTKKSVFGPHSSISHLSFELTA
jgi:hypothetical protein